MNNARRPRRILVPADEFHASLALVRGLRAGGYVPVVAVSRDGTYAALSRAAEGVVRVPSAEDSPDEFAPALARVARELGVAAILPGTEASLIALSRHRDQLPASLGAPAPEVVEIGTDKPRVLELAAQSGLRQPRSIISDPTELKQRADSLSYPAILKPQRTRMELGDGGLAYFKAKRVASPEALRRELGEVPGGEWVVQPYIDGGLFAVSGVASHGRPVALVHQRSVRIWPPEVGYSSYAETTERDGDVELRVTELLSALRWSGIFQLQLLRQADDSPVAIDFNPRAYGSLALALKAGVNLPAIWAACVLGESPAVPAPRPGVRYRLETGDAKAISTMLAGRQFLRAADALRPRQHTAHAIFSLRDPAPLVILGRKALARLAA